MARLKPIEWTGSAARIVDQTLLPMQLTYEDISTVEVMFDAILRLKVRGAPLIGISAAYGLYISIMHVADAGPKDALMTLIDSNAAYLAGSRPTAVNLFWALDRMRARARELAKTRDVAGVKAGLLQEAHLIMEEDRRMCRAIGEYGYERFRHFNTLHTHCNAGGLATGDFGTALAPVYIAQEKGKLFHVYADETRPLLQGSRITAYELHAAGIPVTVICDNMAASVMAQGRVDAVIVGADRIASNGDTANKIGTYGLALIAQAHGVPFYVAAPTSTFDLNIRTGTEIPIEERGAPEITNGMGKRTAPEGVAVYNPAFDVTPHELIAGIITEKGVIEKPGEGNVARMVG